MAPICYHPELPGEAALKEGRKWTLVSLTLLLCSFILKTINIILLGRNC